MSIGILVWVGTCGAREKDASGGWRRVSFVGEPMMHNLLLHMYTILEIKVILQSAVVGG